MVEDMARRFDGDSMNCARLKCMALAGALSSIREATVDEGVGR